MIDRWISRITGKQHHFNIHIRFTPDRKRGDACVERITTVWMAERKNIIDERSIRKQVGPSMVSGTPRHMLNNGGIDIYGAYYLRRFKPELKSQ